MSLELSEPQQKALDATSNEPLRLLDPRTQECYVLVKAEVFDRLGQLLFEDALPSEDEKRQQLAASGERAGWTDPEMDVYASYDENRKLL
jgi:hypothetical protein